MGCCAPQETAPGAEAPSPCKRVNYTMGMLLGVDDFVQESTYHQERARELAREMLGYGTVHGLQVLVEVDDGSPGHDGLRVRVMPGMAWMPSGKAVCVAREQCANLNAWLKANKDSEELKKLPAGTQTLPLYVVLSHAECLTDKVPIPGEPCRDDSGLMKESRVTEAFRLEIRTKPPQQREEDALRDFVAWLMRVPLTPKPPLSEEDFVKAVRAAAKEWLAKPAPAAPPKDYLQGSAPEGTSEALFEVALRLWVTELRPLWMARADCGCDAGPIDPKDDAVLLLKITATLVRGSGVWLVSGNAGSIARDERQRPYVLSLRMVQELVARNPVPEPAEKVDSETSFDQAAKVGTSLRYAREDHTHGTPPSKVGGDLSGSVPDAKVEKLQGTTLAVSGTLTAGDVLTVVTDGAGPAMKWAPQKITYADLAGDVTGEPRANALTKMLGLDMGAQAVRADGEVLTQNGGKWGSAALPKLVGDVTGTLGQNEIGSLQGQPVDARKPKEDQYLRSHDGRWIASPAPFVRRSRSQAYEVVAAAELTLQLTTRAGVKQDASFVHSYGGIGLDSSGGARKPPVQMQKDRAFLRLFVPGTQDADVAPVENFTGHVVKLTPVFLDKTPFFRAFLQGPVQADAKGLRFTVLVVFDRASDNEDWPVGLQVEVSRFEEPR